MAKAPRADPFDGETVKDLLSAVGLEPDTAESESFLVGLRGAVKLYQQCFPKGRPNAEREVLVWRELLDQSRKSGVPGAIGRAALRHRYSVVQTERRTFAEIGRITSQLENQLRALSRDAHMVLADQMFLYLGRQPDVGDVVKVVTALRGACEEFVTGETRHSPGRAKRYDIQVLMDCVVPVFAGNYTRVERLRSPAPDVDFVDQLKNQSRLQREFESGDAEAKKRHLAEALFYRKARSDARELFRTDICLVLEKCFSAAGVEDALDLAGDRAWRAYVLPSLKRLPEQHRYRALWWLPL